MMSSLVFIPDLQSGHAGLMRRRVKNGRDDSLVTGAAAETSRKRLAHPRLIGLRFAPQQIERGQHHTGRAEAALETVIAAERFLQRVQLAAGRQRLDCRDLGIAHLDREHQARAHRGAVE
jgi:hypothetical protein